MGGRLLLASLTAVEARAQTVEVGPFGGYRFGGSFYELVTGTPVDVDGAPSYGGILDVRIGEDLFVEGFFTHQEARHSGVLLRHDRCDRRVAGGVHRGAGGGL